MFRGLGVGWLEEVVIGDPTKRRGEEPADSCLAVVNVLTGLFTVKCMYSFKGCYLDLIWKYRM